MNDVIAALRARLGNDQVLVGDAIGERHRVDFSHENPCMPLALVRPATTGDVAAILAECSRARQRVVVQGGLTGLAGGATPQAGEIAISLERLTGVEEIDRAAQT